VHSSFKVYDFGQLQTKELRKRCRSEWKNALSGFEIYSPCYSDVSESSSALFSQPVTAVAPAKMPRIGRIDERYQSFNVEMLEVIGGRFWASLQTTKRTTGGPDRLKALHTHRNGPIAISLPVGKRQPPGRVSLAPASITFLAISNAGNSACR
jgi:hypothetical protein